MKPLFEKLTLTSREDVQSRAEHLALINEPVQSLEVTRVGAEKKFAAPKGPDPEGKEFSVKLTKGDWTIFDHVKMYLRAIGYGAFLGPLCALLGVGTAFGILQISSWSAVMFGAEVVLSSATAGLSLAIGFAVGLIISCLLAWIDTEDDF